MHVRFSRALGTQVMEAGSGEIIGLISDILIQPNTGKIEGFFITLPSFFATEPLFLSVLDIIHWGTRVTIRDPDALCPVSDLLRLQDLLDDDRIILGQKMITQSGRKIGVCKDVQFDTKKMRVEWLFPKKYFRWGTSLPASEIVEVTSDAIVMKDPSLPVKVLDDDTEKIDALDVLQSLPDVSEPATSRVQQ